MTGSLSLSLQPHCWQSQTQFSHDLPGPVATRASSVCSLTRMEKEDKQAQSGSVEGMGRSDSAHSGLLPHSTVTLFFRTQRRQCPDCRVPHWAEQAHGQTAALLRDPRQDAGLLTQRPATEQGAVGGAGLRGHGTCVGMAPWGGHLGGPGRNRSAVRLSCKGGCVSLCQRLTFPTASLVHRHG